MMIREATEVDAQWILHHRLGMFEAMGESDEFVEETARLTKAFLMTDWKKEYRYFLVELNGEVIGGCGLSLFRVPPMAHQKTGLCGYVSNMYINPEYRGRGYGHALLEHIISLSKDEGIGLLLLHASTKARDFYASEGFNTPNGLMHLITWKH
ncbi:MAG: GNAT family N-acetyltransferase [Candidatus Thorarchaeota archaeon]|nr:GNAT family N-acetyltransferase [Candidatus Thorarchaeota archaeon]